MSGLANLSDDEDETEPTARSEAATATAPAPATATAAEKMTDTMADTMTVVAMVAAVDLSPSSGPAAEVVSATNPSLESDTHSR